jgi:PAS domain S-box-containing protein/diguanylate cyclase (GGDEF)-like protein
LIRPLSRYALGIALALAVAMLLMVLAPQLRGPTLILFTVAIIISAYYGGLGPGLVSTLASFLLASFFLLPPLRSFAIASIAERWQLAILILAGVLISIICESLRQSRSSSMVALATVEKVHIGQARLAAIVESSEDAIIGKDVAGVITSWNRGATRIFGYAADEIIGQPITLLIPADRQAEELEILTSIRNGRHVEVFETIRYRKDGTSIPVAVSASPIKDMTGRIVGASKIARDISVHRQHEQEMARVYRLYATLSEVNQAIVWVPSREALFSKVATSIVETGGFHVAWVGLLDPETGQIHGVAQCGDTTGFLTTIRINAEEGPDGRGQAGTACREGRAYVCNDISADPGATTWRDVAESRGVRAAMVLPIREGGAICGVINVYSRERNAFLEREVALLEEVGVDVSFALDTIAATERRLQAEAALREREETLRIVTGNARIGLMMVDGDLRYTFSNRAYGEYLGLGADIVGKLVSEVSGNDYGVELTDALQAAFNGQRGVIELSRGAGDDQRHFILNFEPIGLRGGISSVVAVVSDVTARIKAEKNLLLLRSAVMQSTESILIMDAGVDPPGPLIEFVNPAFTTMTGYPSEEAVGRSPRILQGPGTDRAVLDRQQRALEGGQVFEGEALNYRKNGSAFMLEWQVAPILDARGVTTHFVVLQRDISARKANEMALLESRQRMQLATQSAGIGVWDFDVRSRKTLWDAQMYALHGEPRPAVFRETYDAGEIRHPTPADQARRATALARTLESGQEFRLEYPIRWPNGELRELKSHAAVQRAADGSAVRLIGVTWDITERKAAEARIRFLTRVQAMFSGIAILMVREHDRARLYSEACRIAVEVGGFTMAVLSFREEIGGPVAPKASAGHSAELLEAIASVLADPAVERTTMTARAMLKRRPVISNDAVDECPEAFRSAYAAAGIRSMAVFPLLIREEVAGAMALFSPDLDFFHAEEVSLLTNLTGDIAFALDSMDKEERLERAAFYDSLTGQANRRLFMDRLQQSLRGSAAAARRTALLLVDLERFKNVNENLGRAAGDLLLRQAGDWLATRIGTTGNLARVGANQFAIALPDAAEDAEVIRWIEQATEAFQAHAFHTPGGEVSLSVRVGIAMSPDDGLEAEVLFGNAEAALAKAKAGGDRYLLFAQKMTESIIGRLSLEHQLRLALVKEEFVLHYQPKFDLVSGKLTGAEALLRWKPEGSGFVPPGRFIHLLEETGMIVDVGNWVVQKALEDHRRWRRQNLPVVRIAVNASAVQLRHRGFVDSIRLAIGPGNLPCDALELEITESVIMKDVNFGIERLNALRDLGLTIAIDDFGTGFSSLSYLSRLPLDTLKIDRAFVVDMVASPTGRALVSTIIRLAEALGLKSVAEGVETDEQRRLLRELHCGELQGFLVGRPYPVKAFEQRFLREL